MFVVGIAGAARSIGGWAMQRWMLLACAALTWIMGSELLIDIWQAHALLLPFLAYLVLMVGLAERPGPLAAVGGRRRRRCSCRPTSATSTCWPS